MMMEYYLNVRKRVTWRLGFVRVYAVLAVIILSGCIPNNTIKGYDSAFIAGGYTGVSTTYEDIGGIVSVDEDDLHELIVAGKAFHDAGKWLKSSQVLELAAHKLKWKEDTIDTPEEVVRFVGTTLTNDTLADYTGKIYEGVMLDYYQALNFLMLGDEAQARIHFNRLAERQSNAQIQLQSYTRTLKKAKTLPDDEGDREIVVSSLKNSKANFKRGRENLPKNSKSAHIRSPSGDLMNAVFRSSSSSSTDRKGRKAARAIDAVQSMAPTSTARRFAGKLEKSLKRSKSNKAYILYEDGSGPKIDEFRIDLPLALVSSKVLYSGVALPEFVQGSANNTQLNIKQGKNTQVTVGVSDLNRIASLEFDSSYNTKVGKEVTSTILKTIAQAAINNKIDEKSGDNPLAGLLMKVAVSVGQAALTQADTRYWNNLPNEIQMAVLNKSGQGSIEIRNTLGELLASVPVTAGNQLIYLRQKVSGGDVKVFSQSLPVKNLATEIIFEKQVTLQN